MARISGDGRSREGAWIEICVDVELLSGKPSRSREGAWIEMTSANYTLTLGEVAPVRERGLKFTENPANVIPIVSLP